ncbi:MAG: hypothetical protein HKO57_03750 [Akkermansiaceae bacterium]|nr:hypothetical protein [Akkermansiaceae bacterium]
MALGLAVPVGAEVRKAPARSLIDSDPEVVYVEEFSAKPIELLVVKPGAVYATKQGKRKLGNLKVDSKATLVGFDERAYKVRGTGQRGGISGWVSPQALGSKDKDFVENLKKVYRRQKDVRELIANQEVAIGMNLAEVSQSLGRPTKTKVRQTAKGQSGQWEFIEYEEIKHYQTLRNPATGGLYRQYTHTTVEELSKLVVEFENDVVTAIEESENNEGGRVRIVVPPIVFGW